MVRRLNSALTAAAARPRLTGRHLVLMPDGSGRQGADALSRRVGLRVGVSSDIGPTAGFAHLSPGEGMLFENLHAALVHPDADQLKALRGAHPGVILATEPERIVYASQQAPGSPPLGVAPAAGPPGATLAVLEWGVTATRVGASQFSGRGVRLAVLDTGVDLLHPDFTGRALTSASFVPGATVNDGNGHGTHCLGVAAGPRAPGAGGRYGVAPDAELYVAKVVGDDGSGTDGNILAGLDWALRCGCAVASLSVGSPVDAADPYSAIFEQLAQRALAQGMLIIAAAGNDSLRPGLIAPVNHPANCPSILAVAAVDPGLMVWAESCGGLGGNGGEVNLAAPGVAIRSTWPRPGLYQLESGTSPATPFAAGIAALLAEANPGARGAALQALLLASVRPLALPTRDVGAGLVQAP